LALYSEASCREGICGAQREKGESKIEGGNNGELRGAEEVGGKNSHI